MDKFKNLSDKELIELLRDYGIKHGPILETTRTLYEKKLVEFERKKKTFPGSADASYESRQQYSKKEYDNDQVYTLNVRPSLKDCHEVQMSGVATSGHFSQSGPGPSYALSPTKSDLGKKKNPANVEQQSGEAASVSQIIGTRATRQITGTRGGKRRKVDTETSPQGMVIETRQGEFPKETRQVERTIETRQVESTIEKRQVQKTIMTRQNAGTIETRQEEVTIEARQKKGAKGRTPKKGAIETAEKQGTIETKQLVFVGKLTPDCFASPTTEEGTQQIEIKVVSPSTTSPKQASPGLCTPELNSEVQKKPEEKSNYHLAMSLIPLLDKVPEEKMATLHRDLVNLITSCYPEAPPKHPGPNTAAPPPGSRRLYPQLKF